MIRRSKKTLNKFIRWFDRSFSSGWGRQVMFLGALLLVFIVFWTAVMYANGNGGKDVSTSFVRTLELILDPGSFGGSNEKGFSVWLQLLVTLTGAVVFTAMLITVLGNIVGNRIENYKKGRVRYNFDDHVLVLGANSMLVNMLKEFIQTGVHDNRRIVVLTSQDTEELHGRILSDVPELEDKLDVTWLNGSRVIEQTLRNVQIDEAYSIYILGEDNELDHDSINLECWRLTKEICKDIRRQVQCYLVVDRVSTYHVLQYGEQAMDTSLNLNIINSLENWAQRVLVSREYLEDCEHGSDKEACRFPAIDRKGITEDSDKTVRFVIVGMNQMSYAMASTVAHIAHFPNFKDGQNRTKICFIAPDIRQEMDYFLGHYDNIFRLSYVTYTCWDRISGKIDTVIRHPDPNYGDFLDVEWEFIDGSIESDNVRTLIHEWASDEKEYLSMAICEGESDISIAASLYLPEIIYKEKVPVFVYQPLSGEVLKFAHGTRRYDNIYPFGMKDECYDPLFRKRIVKAKKINYLYHLQDNSKPYEGMADPDVLEGNWNKRREYIYKLSNLYAANSIPVKLRSVGINPDEIDADTKLTHRQIEILSRIEHNRWNMERLLLGTQPLTKVKRDNINSMLGSSVPSEVEYAKAIKKNLQKNFYHKDIAPNSEIPASSKQYDTAIVTNILDVIRDV